MTDQRKRDQHAAQAGLYVQAVGRVLRPYHEVPSPAPLVLNVLDAEPDTGRVQAIWNRCDGTPGNPGVETIPSEDGPDKVACLGCPACRANGVRARIARTGDVLLGAGPAAGTDDEW